MKILYISSLGFRKGSSASIRNISLINGLVKKGCKVHFLTVKYPAEYEDYYLKEVISKDVSIKQYDIPVLSKYLNKKVIFSSSKEITILSKLKKISKDFIKFLYFFPDTDKQWIKKIDYKSIQEDYDFIISSSDTKTSHFVAKNIKNIHKDVPWYQIWGDPWEVDININKIQKFRIKFFERKLIKNASKIFYVSYPTMNLMGKLYPKYKNKIGYLGRSYIQEVEGKHLGKENKILFSYTGVLNSNRNIEPLLKKIDIYNNIKSKEIILDIYGQVSEEIKKILMKYKFVNIKGTKNTKEIAEVYAISDVLIFIDNGLDTTQIPGKLYDYFGTNRPILALIEDKSSDTTKFINKTDRCIIFENNINNINLDFIDNLSLQPIMREYSGEEVANRLLRYHFSERR